MKTALLSLFAAVTLFAASPATAHDRDGRDDRNSRDFNYGYDRAHRVTPSERSRWEAAHRNDNKNDRREAKSDIRNAKADLRDARRDGRDDRNSKDFNYGYDRSHRVTPQECARWEAAHRYDGRR